MNDSSLSDGAGALGSDTAIYLERDIFFNFRLGRLESAAAVVALNFRECILFRLLLAARVRKQAVIDAAWGDNGVVVTDASYHQLVRSLRKKFEEIGLSGQSIKTLPRFGLEYLRESPAEEPLLKEQMPEAMPASGSDAIAVAEEISVAEAPQAAWYRSGKERMKWSLRVLSWILPFLVGLMIGHLGYRGGRMAPPKAGSQTNLEVSVSRVKASRAPPTSSAVSEPTCRFQCT